MKSLFNKLYIYNIIWSDLSTMNIMFNCDTFHILFLDMLYAIT